jgi:hypothetical protein
MTRRSGTAIEADRDKLVAFVADYDAKARSEPGFPDTFVPRVRVPKCPPMWRRSAKHWKECND